MDSQELATTMASLAQNAVSFVKNVNVTLDFTNESIEKLEGVLAQMHKEIGTANPPEEAFGRMANMFGAYIGETFIKNLGKGEWAVHEEKKALAVKVDSIYIFFPAKAYRRLKEGAADNIVQMYMAEYNKFAATPISLKVFGTIEG